MEELTKTNSWGILISLPILILNYILGLITIEIGDIVFPKVYAKKTQQQFNDNFMKIIDLNNEMLSSRYNEIYQNKRILNGSSIGFILIGVGIFFEGLPLVWMFKMLGFIGFIGSFII